jgi:aryl-alcohol dehydrogenase-like predicted oxidoreductase
MRAGRGRAIFAGNGCRGGPIMNRRDFLKAAASSTAAFATSGAFAQEPSAGAGVPASSSNPAVLPRRGYGKADIQLSIIGMGGILLAGREQADSNRLVAESVERGVNYFDVAPTYGDAELKLGPALEPYRKKVFLACKTTQRQREAAEKELKRSLERLKTDHLDLYQLHGMTDMVKDVDAVFARGGAMEVFIEAKKSGRVRHLGFSAHSAQAALALLDRYDFDSILFPVNFACDYEKQFSVKVVETAERKGVTRLALKAMARQVWPKDDPQRKTYGKCWYQPLTDPRQAELGLRYTLSRPVTAAVPPGEEPLFRLALDVAMRFRPISDKEGKELKALASTLKPIFPQA